MIQSKRVIYTQKKNKKYGKTKRAKKTKLILNRHKKIKRVYTHYQTGKGLTYDDMNNIFDKFWTNLINKSVCFPIDKGVESIRLEKMKEIEKYIEPLNLDVEKKIFWIDFFMIYRIIIYLYIFIYNQKSLIIQNPEIIDKITHSFYYSVLMMLNIDSISIDISHENILDIIKEKIRADFIVVCGYELNYILSWKDNPENKVSHLTIHGIINYDIKQVPRDIVLCFLAPINYLYCSNMIEYDKNVNIFRDITNRETLISRPHCIEEFKNASFFYPEHYYFDLNIAPVTDRPGYHTGMIIFNNDGTETRIQLDKSTTLSNFIRENIKALKNCIVFVEACRPFINKDKNDSMMQELIYNYELFNKEIINTVLPCTEYTQIAYKYNIGRRKHTIKSPNSVKGLNTIKSCTQPKLNFTESDFYVITHDDLEKNIYKLDGDDKVKQLILYLAYTNIIDDRDKRKQFASAILKNINKEDLITFDKIEDSYTFSEKNYDSITLLFYYINKYERDDCYEILKSFILSDLPAYNDKKKILLFLTQEILIMLLFPTINYNFFNKYILTFHPFGNSLFTVSTLNDSKYLIKNINESSMSILVSIFDRVIDIIDNKEEQYKIHFNRLIDMLSVDYNKEYKLLDFIIHIINTTNNNTLKEKLTSYIKKIYNYLTIDDKFTTNKKDLLKAELGSSFTNLERFYNGNNKNNPTTNITNITNIKNIKNKS